MKKLFISLIVMLGAITLAGCTVNENPNNQSSTAISNGNKPFSIANAIVVYFSATNHTEIVAETIANHIGSAIYELEPINAYTSEDLNYNDENSRVFQEHLNSNRHVELVTTNFEGFTNAKYIFLGAPVWWQELSWVVEEFVSDNDFANKTIIPFGTSVSSNFALNNLIPLAEDATWFEPQRFQSNVSKEIVTQWVDGLELVWE